VQQADLAPDEPALAHHADSPYVHAQLLCQLFVCEAVVPGLFAFVGLPALARQPFGGLAFVSALL
jgi:hypothetical protein